MFRLTKLKAAATLHDAADILGFQPKSLAYILYKKSSVEKYTTFEIPKRSGGVRVISAPTPELLTLQKRLAELLQNCIDEINASKKKSKTISHGFRPKHSIFTNASNHRNKNYVFNIDLENFFGTINFGRVRGFFITNKNFALNPTVATILAQIACHNNELPQGAPSSPVISNLIGHILDIRLADLAKRSGCEYSRYADDLTFSTNKPNFPIRIARVVIPTNNTWECGGQLTKLITRAGFSINSSKTRMQLAISRQEVTGLTVNRKVNIRAEYRRSARAMVHQLVKTGSFQIKHVSKDDAGNVVTEKRDGTLEKLTGILSFIDSSNIFNRNRRLSKSDREKSPHPPASYSADEETYRKFLYYKNVFAAPCPTILFEGKTDNTYLACAIRQLQSDYPSLASKSADGEIKLNIRLMPRTATTARMLGIAGGSAQLIPFIKDYLSIHRSFLSAGLSQPFILLIDNDSGAKPLYSYIKNLLKIAVDPKEPFVHIAKNLFLVPTPLTAAGADTMIEDFFDKSVLDFKLSGKKFNPDNVGSDHKSEYGKAYFAEYVVKAQQNTIDFSGFKTLLNTILLVIEAHAKWYASTMAEAAKSAKKVA
jgi:RNA-directed DNA polymerase